MRGAWVWAALILTGCMHDEPPDYVIRLTWIDYNAGFPPMVDVPSIAEVGTDVPVMFIAYRGGCITPERTDIALAIDSADVVPYDREQLYDACTLELRLEPNEVSVRFDTPGPKTIRVHGLLGNSNFQTVVELSVDVTAP